MNGIQIILTAGILILYLYYILRLRNALFDMVIMLLFTGLAIFFIVWPENTNKIAQKLGVGRGADLLFYICILFFLFIIFKIFSRLRRLENTLTELVRQFAKEKAETLPGNNPEEKKNTA